VKTVWYIAQKDLLQTFKDKSSFLFMLIMPLVLIAVLGTAIGNLGGSSGPIQMTVAVSNQDSGYVGKAIEQSLNINNNQLQITLKDYSSSTQVADMVANNSNINAGVVIPAGTTDALLQAAQNNTPTRNLINFYSLPNTNSNDPRVSIAQDIVTGTLNQLVAAQFAGTAAVKQVYAVCNQPGNHCAQSSIDAATIAKIVGTAGATATQQAQVAQLTAGQAVKINNFDQVVPGYAVFFSLFSINAVAGTILQEKEDGTFRRLLIAPIQKYALLGGKMLAQFILTTLQLTVLFGAGYFAFHIHIGNIAGFILLVLGTSFAATGLGIALVSLVKTRRQLAPIVTLVTLLTSAIGGAWWPLWLEPTWMQNIAKVGITAWSMEGLNNLMIYGKDFATVLPNILGLLGYGLICFIIALRFFRFQEKAA
jgi:linearmycin/streptolysin S transport system permease protein